MYCLQLTSINIKCSVCIIVSNPRQLKLYLIIKFIYFRPFFIPFSWQFNVDFFLAVYSTLNKHAKNAGDHHNFQFFGRIIQFHVFGEIENSKYLFFIVSLFQYPWNTIINQKLQIIIGQTMNERGKNQLIWIKTFTTRWTNSQNNQLLCQRLLLLPRCTYTRKALRKPW